MAAVPQATSQQQHPVSDGPGAQDLPGLSKNDESLYKVPQDYFFHNKTHIEEGDVVIIFMVSDILLRVQTEPV